MVLKLQKIDDLSERELEKLVTDNMESIEAGLVYLGHQLNAAGKYIDILAVDENRILVVIELKIGEDDGMLVQALEYLHYVQSNRDRLAMTYKDRGRIDPEEEPRIILVAASFSDRLRRAVGYLEPEVKMVEYQAVKAGGELGLVGKEVVYDTGEDYRAPVSIDTILSRTESQKLRSLCAKVIDEIRDVGKEMDEPKGIGSSEVRLKCKNRVVARVVVRKKFFYIAYLWGDDWKWHEVYSRSDWSKRGPQALKVYRKTYLEVGGAE